MIKKLAVSLVLIIIIVIAGFIGMYKIEPASQTRLF